MERVVIGIFSLLLLGLGVFILFSLSMASQPEVGDIVLGLFAGLALSLVSVYGLYAAIRS